MKKRGVPAPSHSRERSSVSQSLLPFCPLFSTTRTLCVLLKKLLVVYFHVCFSVFLSEEENAQGRGTGQHLTQVGTAHAAEREQTASSRWRQDHMEVTQGLRNVTSTGKRKMQDRRNQQTRQGQVAFGVLRTQHLSLKC